jgi:alpha-L-arabinofuranosidase
VFEITAEPTEEVSYLNSADVMKTTERALAPGAAWEFPPASVSAVELNLAAQTP